MLKSYGAVYKSQTEGFLYESMVCGGQDLYYALVILEFRAKPRLGQANFRRNVSKVRHKQSISGISSQFRVCCPVKSPDNITAGVAKPVLGGGGI